LGILLKKEKEKIKKKKEKKNKKRTNVPLKIKRDLAAQVFLKVFTFLREVYKFLKVAKYSPLSFLYPL
jgi:hypothetical protein